MYDKLSTKFTPKTYVLYEVNMFDHMNAKVDALYRKIDSLSITPSTRITPVPVAFVSPTTLYYEICRVNGYTGRDFQMILVEDPTKRMTIL